MKERVGAIVVAAGESRRMGCCKQLLDLGGKTVIARCIEALRDGGIDEIVVVVGVKGAAVAAEAGRYPVRLVTNPEPSGDMASSVRVGRQGLTTRITGAVVTPCDYPLVTPATIGYLASVHAAAPSSILVPRHGGRKGHPTLFPVALLDELAGGGTLRDVVNRDPARLRLFDVDDPGVLLDMDTPEDYRKLHRLSTGSDAAPAA